MPLSSQQRWNRENREKLKEASKKFRSNNKQFAFTLNVKDDKDLIEWLEDRVVKKNKSLQDILHNIVENAYLKD